MPAKRRAESPRLSSGTGRHRGCARGRRRARGLGRGEGGHDRPRGPVRCRRRGVRMSVRRGGPALAGMAARRMAPAARGDAGARERGAEAASGFDRTFSRAQVVLRISGEPEKAGEAATMGHAPTTRSAASAPGYGRAFPARSYLFLGVIPHPAAAPRPERAMLARGAREGLGCGYANPPRRPRPLGPVRVQHHAGRPRRAAIDQRWLRPGRRHLRDEPPARRLWPLDPADDPDHRQPIRRVAASSSGGAKRRPEDLGPILRRRHPRAKRSADPRTWGRRTAPSSSGEDPRISGRANLRRGPRVAAARRPRMTAPLTFSSRYVPVYSSRPAEGHLRRCLVVGRHRARERRLKRSERVRAMTREVRGGDALRVLS
jgi:hypothetical protein